MATAVALARSGPAFAAPVIVSFVTTALAPPGWAPRVPAHSYPPTIQHRRYADAQYTLQRLQPLFQNNY